jgi:hypothetical protein
MRCRVDPLAMLCGVGIGVKGEYNGAFSAARTVSKRSVEVDSPCAFGSLVL